MRTSDKVGGVGVANGDGASSSFFFFQAEDGIRDYKVTGVQTCALPISLPSKTTLSAAPATPAAGANDAITITVASGSSSSTATPTGTLTVAVDGTTQTSSLALVNGAAVLFDDHGFSYDHGNLLGRFRLCVFKRLTVRDRRCHHSLKACYHTRDGVRRHCSQLDRYRHTAERLHR